MGLQVLLWNRMLPFKQKKKKEQQKPACENRLQADKMHTPAHGLVWPNLLPVPVRTFLINYITSTGTFRIILPCFLSVLSNHMKQSRKDGSCVWFSLAFSIDWQSRYAFLSSVFEHSLLKYVLLENYCNRKMLQILLCRLHRETKAQASQGMEKPNLYWFPLSYTGNCC